MKKGDFDLQAYFRDNLFMLLFLFSALAMLLVSGITILNMEHTVANLDSAKQNMNTTADFLIYNYKMRLTATAAAAGDLLDVDDLDKLRVGPNTPSGPEGWKSNSDYAHIRKRLIEFGEENGLEYIYFYFRIDDYLQPLIDNGHIRGTLYTPASELIKIGADARDAWNKQRITIATATDQSFIDADGLMTAYAPVLGAGREVIALVGVDIKDKQVNILQRQIESLSANTASLSRRIFLLIIGMVLALTLLVSGGVITFSDNKKRAEALRDALTQAEHASRAKSDFLANMSHEMR
ncbi:MAG: hypothetical protein FWF04_04270, partial [Clostridiales bacterium]|nr:hypothetical protein [Clostridiales bacterium]